VHTAVTRPQGSRCVPFRRANTVAKIIVQVFAEEVASCAHEVDPGIKDYRGNNANFYLFGALGKNSHIGQSTSPRQRWFAHHRLKQLNEQGGCCIAWMEVSDIGLLDDLERACIEHFSPMLNRSPVLDRRSERGQIQVSEETAEEVIEAAQKEHRALSQMLRVIVEEWAESHRRQK